MIIEDNTRVVREFKIIETDTGHLTLILKVDDGTATIMENLTMSEILDYLACVNNLELIRQGAAS